MAKFIKTHRSLMISQYFLLDIKIIHAEPSQRTSWKDTLSKSRVQIIESTPRVYTILTVILEEPRSNKSAICSRIHLMI